VSDSESIDLAPVCTIQPVGCRAMRGRLPTIGSFGSTGWRPSPSRMRIPLPTESIGVSAQTGDCAENQRCMGGCKLGEDGLPATATTSDDYVSAPRSATVCAIVDELGRPQRCLRLTVRTQLGAPGGCPPL